MPPYVQVSFPTVDQEVGDSNSPGGTRLSLEIDGLSQAVGQIGISDPLWNTCPYTSIVSSRQLWWWSAPTVAYGVKMLQPFRRSRRKLSSGCVRP